MKFGTNQAISQTITQLSCIQLETPSSRLINFWWIKTYTTFKPSLIQGWHLVALIWTWLTLQTKRRLVIPYITHNMEKLLSNQMIGATLNKETVTRQPTRAQG